MTVFYNYLNYLNQNTEIYYNSIKYKMLLIEKQPEEKIYLQKEIYKELIYDFTSYDNSFIKFNYILSYLNDILSFFPPIMRFESIGVYSNHLKQFLNTRKVYNFLTNISNKIPLQYHFFPIHWLSDGWHYVNDYSIHIINNRKHREDGPALIHNFYRNVSEFWLFNEQYSEQEYKEELYKININKKYNILKQVL